MLAAAHYARRSLSALFALAFGAQALCAKPSAAAKAKPVAADALSKTSAPLAPSVYRLETVEVIGTQRVSAEQLSRELGLTPGIRLDDDMVMTTRTRLLSLGLFRSAILAMRKGSQKGRARLLVEVEDDDDVLTDWALGGELDVTYGDAQARTVDPNTPPLGYRLGLVARNIFDALHRASLQLDVDGSGNLREGSLAYGLPRFALEAVQFDASVAAVDVSRRYLDALGFGGTIEGLWSRSHENYNELQYGMAMYLNRGPRFAVPGFPGTVAGPKVGLVKETRLRGFFPTDGERLEASLLANAISPELSVAKLGAARTLDLGHLAFVTLEAQGLSVGTRGASLRGETRLDVPFPTTSRSWTNGWLPWTNLGEAGAFLRLRGGVDRYRFGTPNTNLVGSAAILGLRYHSAGFIAELALEVTRSPGELEQDLGHLNPVGERRR